MIPQIQAYIEENWNKFGFVTKPEKLLFIKFAARPTRDPRLGLVVFLVKKVVNGIEQVGFILKVPRYPHSKEARTSLSQEYENLLQMSKKLTKAELHSSIPSPIFFHEIDSYQVSAQTFMSGRNMGQLVAAHDPIERASVNFGIVFDWLTRFQKEFGIQEHVIDDVFMQTYVQKAVEELLKIFPRAKNTLSEYFQNTTTRISALKRQKLPLCPQHGDFHASNIFVKKSRVSGVIDWEDFTPMGLPFYDLCTFLYTYTEVLYQIAFQTKEPSMIEYVYNGSTYFKSVQNFIQKYCELNHISLELIDVFLPIFLIDRILDTVNERKRAHAACLKLHTLLQLKPKGLTHLLTLFSLFPYKEIAEIAKKAGSDQLYKECNERIKHIMAL